MVFDLQRIRHCFYIRLYIDFESTCCLGHSISTRSCSRHNPKLLTPYSVALILCLVAFTSGVWVLRKTGIRTGKLFSQILVTTRNPFLDEISRGNSLRSADAYALKQQRLIFGELKQFGDVDGSYNARPTTEGLDMQYLDLRNNFQS